VVTVAAAVGTALLAIRSLVLFILAGRAQLHRIR
jgi:hypothetical protein